MRTAAKDFKMTELGPIPKDWEVKRLGELLEFKNGYNTDASNFGKGVPFASVLDALSDRPATSKSILGRVVATRKAEDEFSLTYGDLIFTRSSETLEDVGRSNVYVDRCQGAIFGGFVIRGRPIFKFDSVFLNYLLKDGAHRIRVYSQGAGAQHYNIGQTGLGRVTVTLPPLPEQRKIAAALSDVDEMIAALERLIEKKRKIKTGAMQRLLTGKTRLPGFKGAWVEKRLGEVGETYNGIGGKTKDDFGKGPARYITFLNVLTNPVLDETLFEPVNVLPADGQNRAKKGDLFFNTSSETPEEVGICSMLATDQAELYLNSFCFGFRLFDDNVSPLFLSYYFRSADGRLLMTTLAQGSTRYNLSKESFKEACIVIPPSLAEQKAIAKVLGDMDEEIAALEAELAKTRQLKQGMMQELLTGKVRLV